MNKCLAGLIFLMVMAPQNQLFAAHEKNNVIKLDEIVITAEKIDRFADQYPHQVVSVDADEIKKRNFLDVHEALATLPGVDVKTLSTGLGAKIAIRGGGGSGPVLVLIDGRPVNTSQYGGVDLSSLPMDMIRKITVFKPPVPVWLGHGGNAGVIYIETQKGKPDIPLKTESRVSVSGGSYGLANVNGTCKVGTPDIDALFAAGFNHRDGKRPNSEKNKGTIALNLDRTAEDLTQYQLNGKYYHSSHGVSGPTYKPTPNAKQRYDHGSLDVRMKGGWGESTDYDVKAYGDTILLKDQADSGDIYTLDLYKLGVGAEVVRTGFDAKQDIRLGGSGEMIQADHTTTGRHHRETASVHAEHTYRLAPATLTTGARVDYASDFGFSPAGNIGCMFNIAAATTLKASVGYAVNLPSFGQLYQPSHGSYDQVRGNPDLVSEKATSYTLSVAHTFSVNKSASIALFRTDIQDLIQYQRGADLISRPQNIGRAYKQGMEAGFKYTLNDWFGLDANYIWQQTGNAENDTELTYSPAHQGKLTLKSTLPFRTRLELMIRAYDSQYTDTDNTFAEAIDGYVTTDVKAIHPITLFSVSSELYIHFINLLDQAYESHYGYPDDGFRFVAGVSMNL